MIAAWHRERAKCQFCGNPRADCENSEHEWYPQRTVDYAEMATRAAQWLYANKHEDAPFHDGTFESWVKERSVSHPFHFSDGVRIWVSREDLTPDDMFI